MVILIDPPLWPAHGRRWSHLASDTSVRELHVFAARLGIPERGFEGDHYDVPEERYAQAVRAGAVPVSTRELLRRLQVCGLRRTKRRGERVVASHRDEVAGHRVDAVLSAKPPLGPVIRVHAVLVHGGHVLVCDDGVGYRLPSADVHGSVGDDLTAWAVGQELAVALVGAGRLGVPARQVGYLRRVREGSAAPVGIEVVLRWPDVAAPAGDPGMLQWVPVRRAVVLLPVDLAPIALNEYHRARPPEAEDPGPLNPGGR